MDAIGGLDGLFAHEAVKAKMSITPTKDSNWVEFFHHTDCPNVVD
jgi:hypothetical protein